MKTVFILLTFITLSYAYCNSDSKNFEVKLKNDILCHYKKDERPNQAKLPIELNYLVSGFDFNEERSELEVQSRILHRWDDLRLKWDESQYDGIQMIHVPSEDIWVPQLFLNDSHHHYGLGTCHPVDCLLKSSGQLGCRFPCLQTITCDADYFDWPFDSHECKAVFRTFLVYEEVEFDPNQLGGIIAKNQNNEWKLTSINGTINLNDKSIVNFTFRIQRFSGTLFKHVVVPGYVLIIFSLLILWMEPNKMWRVIFCGVNIYLHFSLMDRIWWQFPTNGVSRNVPRILKYSIFMLIFSTIILIQSILFRMSSIRYPKPPIWIIKIVELFETNSIMNHFIFSIFDTKSEILEEEKENENIENAYENMENVQENSDEIQVAEPKIVKTNYENTEDMKIWLIFYRIIDRLMFIVFSISYTLYDGY
ncbi:hypothetical protein PVAND_000328 [Polypedilum vanderplanki]|uniref:Neurotransmitter-gated ion-channel ligand-binding domain-containing protein n=1 Tax=Polypedilum vanderplanki TaxID=319348 RepID=A0A9J6BJY7_POLVA|nr:hypothetical protein PVAND_000328 [Polypedilum vanderplanki]